MSDINSLPHLDTATGPGEYQWCRVRVTIEDGQDKKFLVCADFGSGPAALWDGNVLEFSIERSKHVMLSWSAEVTSRLIREHAWLLDMMRSVYDCRPDSDTIMERMREETQ